MLIKKKLTAVAVDSCREYLNEKLEQIKELDLDHDRRKDVDQVAELLMSLSDKLKDAIESTDFPKLAAGFEQIMSGAAMIGASVDRAKLSDACTDFGMGMQKLGGLLQLGVEDIKQSGKENSKPSNK